MTRWHAVIIVLIILAALFVVQRQRLALVRACTEAGGAWDGAVSVCRPIPGAPILQRDIRRS
jgi:hypothetical protein